MDKLVGIRQLQLEEGSRRTKKIEDSVELPYRAMIRIILLFVKIESKSSAFGTRGSSGEERGAF